MSDASRNAAFRAIVVLSVLCVGLAVACVLLWRKAELHLASPDPDEGVAPISQSEQAMNDPKLHEQATREAVQRGEGIWDTVPDPAVGRLLQPYLKNRLVTGSGFHVTSNSYGLRERQFEMPKPDGTVRVVLLGDSYVMGHGVEEQDRLGVFLEKWLKERSSGAHGPIEVLHVGVETWNVVAEATYLRRTLHFMRPDLVLHFAVRNDVEDNAGARGFGELSNFNPLHPERGDLIFKTTHPSVAFKTRQNNWIAHGLDWESRERYGEQAAAVDALATELAAIGARYVLVDNFMGLVSVARHFLMGKLRAEQTAFLPTALTNDKRYRNSESDAHWNRAGHELVAKMFYSLMQRRGLLPTLHLGAWPEADAVADDWLKRGDEEAAKEPDFDRLPGRRQIDSAVDFTKVDDDHGAQVHGGVFAGGLVGPYAAVVMRDEGRRKLHVAGAALGRHELDGTVVDVFVEEAKVGSFPLKGQEPIDARFDVPEDVAKRKFVSVRFVSPNWAYDGLELRLHVVFQIASLALE